jgi:hypothetical protein
MRRDARDVEGCVTRFDIVQVVIQMSFLVGRSSRNSAAFINHENVMSKTTESEFSYTCLMKFSKSQSHSDLVKNPIILFAASFMIFITSNPKYVGLNKIDEIPLFTNLANNPF